MTMPVARWPPPHPRAEQVTRAVTEALARYRDVLDASIDLRSVTLDIKLKNDGSGVRTVIVTFQGET
jgi:hypothetical protein